jgi:predicted nucleotidyltransferase
MDTVTGLGDVLLGKTRGAVLGLLLSRPDEELHVRQIARLSGASLGPVQRELRLLAKVGILTFRHVGNQVQYRANTASPVYHELRGLIVKTVGVADVLRKALEPLQAQIRLAFLYGSFAQGRYRASSDVDVMIIGDAPLAAVVQALAVPQRQLGREINPTIYRATELAAQLQVGHHFLKSVMESPKIFLIGDALDIPRVAEQRLVASTPSKPAGSRRITRRRGKRSVGQRRSKTR